MKTPMATKVAKKSAKKVAKKVATRKVKPTAASAKVAKVAKSTGAKRAQLAWGPKDQKSTKKYLPGVFAALNKHFAVTETHPLFASAKTIANALKGVLVSSDTDCEYEPCVISGVDLEDDKAFYGALGIKKSERIDVGGDDNEKLATYYGGGKKRAFATVQLLTDMRESDEYEAIEEYYEASDIKKLKAAAKVLDSAGVVVGIRLCADNVSTALMVVARTKPNIWVGVMSYRVDT